MRIPLREPSSWTTLFSTEISLEERDKPLETRPRDQKTKVLVMAESKIVENPKPGKKPKKARYLKMKVISDLKSGTITRNVKEHVESTADLTTDDSTSYTKLKEHVHSHTASVIPHEDLSKVLLVHTRSAMPNDSSWACITR